MVYVVIFVAEKPVLGMVVSFSAVLRDVAPVPSREHSDKKIALYREKQHQVPYPPNSPATFSMHGRHFFNGPPIKRFVSGK
jgi:hypothetical protein